MSTRDKVRNYLTVSGIAILFVVVVLFLKETFSAGQPERLVRDLCDAFFISAVFIAGVGGLFWAASFGTFDIFGYSIGLTFDAAFSFKKNWKKKEDFYEYKVRKGAKRAEYRHLLIIGGVMLVIAMYALLMYSLMF